MPIYEITDPRTNKTLEFEGANPPDQRTIMEAFSRAAFAESKIPEEHPLSGDTPEARMKAMNPDYRPTDPSWAGESPNLYAGVRTARDIIAPTIEGLGLVGGGIAGTPGGPVAQMVGASLGYAGAKRLTKAADVALGFEQPESLGEAVKQTGKDVAEGAALEAGGQVIGKGAGLATQQAKKLIPEGMPERIYGAATKMPLSKKWKQRLPGEELNARQKAVKAGLEGGILPNEAGLAEVRNIIKMTTDQIDEVVREGAKKGHTIKTQDVLNSLERSYKAAENSSDPITAKRMVDRIGEKFLKGHGDTIPVDKALGIKRQIGKEVSFGKFQNLTKEANKDLRYGLNEKLKEMYPELKGLNTKDEAYIKLNEALESAVGRIGNRDIISLGDEITATTGAVAGGPLGAGLLVTAKKVLSFPTVRARLAIALHKAGAAKMGGASRELAQDVLSMKARPILNSNISDTDKERFLTNLYKQNKE